MARPPRQPPMYAERGDVEAAAVSWTTQQLECRDMGHHWVPMDAVHIRRLQYYRVSHNCSRCGMVRVRELSESGHVYATSYEYPDGYLLQGLGRIAGDGKDAIRLAALLRGDVAEIKGRAKDTDLPRFGATRQATETGSE
jgi:hypothetical protein